MALDSSGVFRALSAEAMLDLSHLMCRVTFSPGETIVWKGDRDTDVYLIVRGQAEVLAPDGSEWVRLATLGAGETIGEMAFLARAERSATVRATTTMECFVMTEAELRILAYEYPSILTQIAAVLTRRLALRPTIPQERRRPAENSAPLSISVP